MYYDCVLVTQDGRYVPLEGKDRHLILKFEVRDECFIVEYDNYANKFKNCIAEKDEDGKRIVHKKIVPYVRDRFNNMCTPTEEDFENNNFKFGYVDCIRIYIPKDIFCESGVMKVSVCNITHLDDNFRDKTQEVWSIKDITTIKYKSYE